MLLYIIVNEIYRNDINIYGCQCCGHTFGAFGHTRHTGGVGY